ncbi:unnamed protein product [Rhodiola kirilowii]
MQSSSASAGAAKITFRLIIAAILITILLFYVGRPLYWKISATVHDIRTNKQTVKQGLSSIVKEAQKTVGWYTYSDESDSGASSRHKLATDRRILRTSNRSILKERWHIRGV